VAAGGVESHESGSAVPGACKAAGAPLQPSQIRILCTSDADILVVPVVVPEVIRIKRASKTNQDMTCPIAGNDVADLKFTTVRPFPGPARVPYADIR
jgi:hypothetical protein